MIRFVDAKVSSNAVSDLLCSRCVNQNCPSVILLMLCGQPLQERYETTYFAPFKVGVSLCMHKHANCDHTLHS